MPSHCLTQLSLHVKNLCLHHLVSFYHFRGLDHVLQHQPIAHRPFHCYKFILRMHSPTFNSIPGLVSGNYFFKIGFCPLQY